MNEELETRIEQALALVSNRTEYLLSQNLFNQYTFVYPFTNENLKGYFDQLEFNNKSVLTVCGSGDQILNAILLGAKKIDVFDINELSFMICKLKLGAIKALSYDEYFKYFCTKTFKDATNRFGIKLYWKISQYLDDETRIFWDNLYLEENGQEIRESFLFHDFSEDKKYLTKVNNYLSEENYYKLRDLIDRVKINYIGCDIKELSSKLEDSYDYIFLSNIAHYIPSTNIWNREQSEEEINKDINELRKFKSLVESLSEFLEENGVLFVSYIWDIFDINKDPSRKTIDKSYMRDIVFQEDNYKYLTFPSTEYLVYRNFGSRKEKLKDGVLIYQKEKR